MTQKTRLISLICAGFLATILIFTSVFIVYFEKISLKSNNLVDATTSTLSYSGMNFGDLTSLAIVFAIVALLIYLIIKS